MKKVTILISMIMVLLCLGGCNMNKSNIESNGDFATLTEQQKQILTEEGLPLDYNSLTESQQM